MAILRNSRESVRLKLQPSVYFNFKLGKLNSSYYVFHNNHFTRVYSTLPICVSKSSFI